MPILGEGPCLSPKRPLRTQDPDHPVPYPDFSMQPRFPTVFFDLDGTLTDSAPGILNSCEYALSRLGIGMEREAMYAFIGPPLLDTFTRVTGSPELGKRALDLYREYFADRGIFENSVYPGIGELLRDLVAAGCRNVLATAKPEVYARRILEHFGLARYFAYMGGADLNGPVRTKYGVIERDLAITRADPSLVLMVGDRRDDVDAAKRLGIATAAAGWGYAEPGEVDHADFVCRTPGEVYATALGQ